MLRQRRHSAMNTKRSGMNGSKYDVIVVGAGMMGSATAKYLAAEGLDTLLVGPTEGDGSGIHGSHHDEARITRYSGPDLIWSHLASASLRQYPEIERQSGLTFHSPCGHLRCDLPESHPGSQLSSVRDVTRELGIEALEMGGEEVRLRLPYLRFGESNVFTYEGKPSGIINPRVLVRAQQEIGTQRGLRVVRDVVEKIQPDNGGFSVISRQSKFECEKVVVAAGSYAALMSLLRETPVLNVRPETVLLVEVSAELQAEFSEMPGIIWNFDHHPDLPYAYILPPVLYPDGRHYIKIGADHDKDVSVTSVEACDSFMSGDGSKRTASALHELLLELIPSLNGAPMRSKPCLLTYTSHGNPYIDEIMPGWFVTAGGCGKAAKSSDQIGLLASCMVLGESWPEPFQRADFAVSWEHPARNGSKL